jgi:hypothetical protein
LFGSDWFKQSHLSPLTERVKFKKRIKTNCRKDAFEDYKNYIDSELGKIPETERRFYQRLRDTLQV